MEKLNQTVTSKLKDQLTSVRLRMENPTPPFFKKLRLAGLMLAAAGTALVAAPVALPAAVVTISGYLILGGSVLAAVSQAAIEEPVETQN